MTPRPEQPPEPEQPTEPPEPSTHPSTVLSSHSDTIPFPYPETPSSAHPGPVPESPQVRSLQEIEAKEDTGKEYNVQPDLGLHTPANAKASNPHRPHDEFFPRFPLPPLLASPKTPTPASHSSGSSTWPDSGETGFIGMRRRPYDYETPTRSSSSLSNELRNGTPSPIITPPQPLYRSLFPPGTGKHSRTKSPTPQKRARWESDPQMQSTIDQFLHEATVPTSDDDEAAEQEERPLKRRKV